jgi:hypothetical protein
MDRSLERRPRTFESLVRYRVCLSALLLLGMSVSLSAEDCEPKKNCDATRECGDVDTTNCQGLTKIPCEIKKAARNRVAKGYCEAQKSLEKLDCERLKIQQKKACELGLDGPFSCSAGEVLSQLRTAHQDGLTDFAELSGYVTTPLKKLSGQLSWRETACHGSGTGIPYRNSQRSTDEFCTVDVKLSSFTIDGQNMPSGERFIRLEMLPGGRGATICAKRTISTRDTIKFGGPVKIDKHPGERWLEVHVTGEFDFVLPESATPLIPGNSKLQPGRYVVVKGDCLSRIAERVYGRQIWRVIFNNNRATIKNPDLIFPGQDLTLPVWASDAHRK